MDTLIKIIALVIFGGMVLMASGAMIVSASSWLSRPTSPATKAALFFGLVGVVLTLLSDRITALSLAPDEIKVEAEATGTSDAAPTEAKDKRLIVLRTYTQHVREGKPHLAALAAAVAEYTIQFPETESIDEAQKKVTQWIVQSVEAETLNPKKGNESKD